MDASRKPSIATEVHASHERPYRLALLATSPVATGEAKIGNPRKGTEPMHRANQPNKKSSHISGCSFRVLSLMRFSLPAKIIKEDDVKRSF